ncbi:MAG: hypothetical protein ACLP59_04690 [Bryobacteraceae bacterium]
MIPALQPPTGLSTDTLRGWFWETAKPLIPELTGNELGYLLGPLKSSIGATLPSLDEALTNIDARTSKLDLSLRAVQALGFTKIQKLIPLVVKLVYEIDSRFPVPIPVIEQGLHGQLPWLEATTNTLSEMVRYAAINVTSFKDSVAQGRLTEIMNRAWAANLDADKKELVTKSSAPVVGRVSLGQLASMAEGVIGAKAGVCTSFAATAVHLVLNDVNVQQSKPRIEYVAAPNHCICLVNRTPDVRDKPDGTITPYAGWNPEVVIVDPWAGAMGYHVISSPANYPKKLKILIEHKLTQYFDAPWG